MSTKQKYVENVVLKYIQQRKITQDNKKISDFFFILKNVG